MQVSHQFSFYNIENILIHTLIILVITTRQQIMKLDIQKPHLKFFLFSIVKNYNRLEFAFHYNMSVLLLREQFFVFFSSLCLIVFSGKLTQEYQTINVKKLQLDPSWSQEKSEKSDHLFPIFTNASQSLNAFLGKSLLKGQVIYTSSFTWVS